MTDEKHGAELPSKHSLSVCLLVIPSGRAQRGRDEEPQEEEEEELKGLGSLVSLLPFVPFVFPDLERKAPLL